MAGVVLDVVLAIVLLGALLGGLSRGLLASLGTLVGLVVGGFAAWWLLPWIGTLIPWPESRGVLTLLAGIVLLAAGAAAGGAVGAALRRRAERARLKPLDRTLGAALSVVVAALSLSLVAQSVAVAGIPVVSAAVSSSQVLRAIDTVTPRPLTAALAQLRQTVLADGLPQLGQLIELGPAAPGAPEVDLDDPALDTAAQSVARISGTAYACGKSLTGSGFVIAEDRIVTNAHVVAGVDTPVVELPGRAAVEGRVVWFDPGDDLAVIAADVDAAPLPVADPLAAGEAGVIDGYPFGGPFTTGEAVVRSVGTVNVPDIYGASAAPREIYALDGTVQPGNSGGPFLTTTGEVAGVVFARADDGSSIGYAMTTTELAPVLAQAPGLTEAVSTGSCVG